MNCDLVSIDIGKRVSGVALWADGVLVEAREIHAAGEFAMSPAIIAYARPRLADDAVQWVVEAMVDYEAKGARAADLETLRRITGRLKSEITELPGIQRLKTTRAHAWKAGVPKQVTALRAWAALSEDERMRVLDMPRASALIYERFTKETGDAVGLGLTRLARLGRGLRSSRSARRRPR